MDETRESEIYIMVETLQYSGNRKTIINTLYPTDIIEKISLSNSRLKVNEKETCERFINRNIKRFINRNIKTMLKTIASNKLKKLTR